VKPEPGKEVKKGVVIEEILKNQKRGQLMGSIISFPFLCIINIALMRASYELAHGCEVSLDDLPVLVNGDDCLTAYRHPSFPKIWEGLGRVTGLTKSVGKTYDSLYFCCINSMFYVRQRNGLWKEVPYVNMGLLYGVKGSDQSDKDTAKAAVLQLGPIHKELLRLAGDDTALKAALTERFVYFNHKTLKTFKGPWNLPTYLCGLGLNHSVPTKRERQVITWLRMKYGEGTEVPRATTDVEWRLHNKVKDYMKEKNPLLNEYRFKKYAGEEGYGKAYVALLLSVV
jgi:hypothetical protein